MATDNPFLSYVRRPGQDDFEVNPNAQNPFQGPPSLPADYQQRVTGWQGFMNSLSQPGMAQALLNAGATMLAPRTGGMSQAGQIARGLAVGGQTLIEQQDRAEKAQERKDLMAIRKKQLGLEETRTGYEGRRLTQQERESQAQIAKSKEELNALIFSNSPEMQKLTMDAAKAKIEMYRQKGAAAGRTGAKPNDTEYKMAIAVDLMNQAKMSGKPITYGQALINAAQAVDTSKLSAEEMYVKGLTAIAGYNAAQAAGMENPQFLSPDIAGQMAGSYAAGAGVPWNPQAIQPPKAPWEQARDALFAPRQPAPQQQMPQQAPPVAPPGGMQQIPNAAPGQGMPMAPQGMPQAGAQAPANDPMQKYMQYQQQEVLAGRWPASKPQLDAYFAKRVPGFVPPQI